MIVGEEGPGWGDGVFPYAEIERLERDDGLIDYCAPGSTDLRGISIDFWLVLNNWFRMELRAEHRAGSAYVRDFRLAANQMAQRPRESTRCPECKRLSGHNSRCGWPVRQKAAKQPAVWKAYNGGRNG